MTISVHVTSHKHDVLVIRTFLLRYLEDKNWSYYTVSQKKTSPTFLAITRESIDRFL